MASEFRGRYGIPFEPMMKSIPDNVFKFQEPIDANNSRVLTYIGGLHLNRWKSLLKIASSIGPDCELRIFSPETDIVEFADVFRAYPNIRMGSLSLEAVFPEMRRAGILVHVESFDAEAAAYTRLSVSTKIPQYMAARKPILAYGPESLASLRLIRRSGCGIAVNDRHPEDLLEAIRGLLDDHKRSEQYADQGFNYARCHFSSSAVIARLQRVLLYAADKGCWFQCSG